MNNQGKIVIDVVVPSARPSIKKLSAITKLRKPLGTKVHFIFVIDDPGFSETELKSLSSEEDITIIKNKQNLGASLSRNQGFELGHGDYVLFIDDDTKLPLSLLECYLDAIMRDPSAPGFIGPVYFPPSINSHTKAALASDILTFWDIAAYSPKLAWGITANLMVKRESVGNIRFSEKFPKKGGGEDVDFCLRVIEKSGSWFTSVPNAKVIHPWWDYGRMQYKRFARWSYGDSSLPKLHPRYKFRNAPNFIEVAIILSILSVFSLFLFEIPIGWLLVWLITAFCGELIVDGIRMRFAQKNQDIFVSLQATLIRLSNDLGRIIGSAKNFRILGFTERFDYFMTGEHIKYERKVAYIKFTVYISLAIVIFAMLK